eukprot:scaffold238238_cov49-Prasinocladus_malaysianus.AAC.1
MTCQRPETAQMVATLSSTGTKPAEECKRHFFQVFIEHEDFPKPKPTELDGAGPSARRLELASPSGVDKDGDAKMLDVSETPGTPQGGKAQGRATTAEAKGKPSG